VSNEIIQHHDWLKNVLGRRRWTRHRRHAQSRPHHRRQTYKVHIDGYNRWRPESGV